MIQKRDRSRVKKERVRHKVKVCLTQQQLSFFPDLLPAAGTQLAGTSPAPHRTHPWMPPLIGSQHAQVLETAKQHLYKHA